MKDAPSTQAASPAVPSKADEMVLVAPTRAFHEIGAFQGLLTEGIERYAPLFDAPLAQYMRRGDAEADPEFKQLIPYAIFRAPGSAGEPTIFAYRRGKGQGEARLRSKWSAGIGGHVNDGDDSASSVDSPFDAGAKREIAEEVVLDAPIVSFERVGLVNDDATEVGKVHMGVVCLVDLAAPLMRSNEPDLLEARFRPLDELLREIADAPDRFESWTVLALNGLFGK